MQKWRSELLKLLNINILTYASEFFRHQFPVSSSQFCTIAVHEILTITRRSPAKYLGDAMSEFKFRFYAGEFLEQLFFSVPCIFFYIFRS